MTTANKGKRGGKNWVNNMKEDLAAAMVKAGQDPASVKTLYGTIDSTWGDKTGFVFTGPDALAERAANFCSTWIHKNLTSGYDNQVDGSYRGTGEICVSVETLRLNGVEPAREYGSQMVKGHVTAAVYYPCAE